MLADDIARFRRRARITQRELASRLGVSVRSVKRWEKGTLPRRETLDRLGAALSMSPSERRLAFSARLC